MVADARQIQRNWGLDLLRIFAMFLVVLRHGTYQSGATQQGDVLSVNYLLAVGIADVTGIAVNCFILISAYFLCTQNFRLTRIVKLWAMVLFYTIFFSAIAVIAAGFPVTPKLLFSAFLPISSYFYWFISLYFVLSILSPFLNRALMSLPCEQFRILLLILLFFFSVIPSCGSNSFVVAGGYNIIWFIVLYCCGAYCRRFGIQNSARSNLFWCLLFMALSFSFLLLKKMLKKHGIELVAPDNYDFLLTFLTSFFCFRFFAGLTLNNNLLLRAISFLSPLMIGVYLFHDNILKQVIWQNVMRINTHCTSVLWVLYILGAVLVVFFAGAIFEMIRTRAAQAMQLDLVYDKIANYLSRLGVLLVPEKKQ